LREREGREGKEIAYGMFSPKTKVCLSASLMFMEYIDLVN
jgi:hypothetical protein